MRNEKMKTFSLFVRVLFVLFLVVVVFAGVTATVSHSLNVSGLGNASTTLSVNFVGSESNAICRNYRSLTDVNEALGLGDVSEVSGILLGAVESELWVDCDFSSSFDVDIKISEGESAYFKPAGVVYVSNADGDSNEVVYEYLIFGTR